MGVLNHSFLLCLQGTLKRASMLQASTASSFSILWVSVDCEQNKKGDQVLWCESNNRHICRTVRSKRARSAPALFRQLSRGPLTDSILSGPSVSYLYTLPPGQASSPSSTTVMSSYELMFCSIFCTASFLATMAYLQHKTSQDLARLQEKRSKDLLAVLTGYTLRVHGQHQFQFSLVPKEAESSPSATQSGKPMFSSASSSAPTTASSPMFRRHSTTEH